MLQTKILVKWKFAICSPTLDTKKSHSANLNLGFAVGLERTLLSIGLFSLMFILGTVYQGYLDEVFGNFFSQAAELLFWGESNTNNKMQRCQGA